MHWLATLLGEGKDLNLLQMSLRAFIVFIAALVMLRVTGQRTFGNRSALDNVVMIILGAILSRAVTGSSPFIPVMGASLVIVLFHRCLSWLALWNKTIGKWVKGNPVLLFRDGHFKREKMRKALLSDEDVKEGVRMQLNEDSVENIAQIYMERCGGISVVKKSKGAQ